ncbi:MAG: nucleoside deaminase [Acidobacteria bacterium]|nr:nucleoside deaminase [Acidobacteriota bacterium]
MAELDFYEERFMREALLEAERAALEQEVPIGAVVVFMRKIVGRGHNNVLTTRDPTGHAEVVAMRDAARTLENYRLPDCDIYVTVESCAMCAGAMVHARIRNLFYGAADPKGGAVESTQRLLQIPQLNHRVLARGHFLEREAAALLREFFLTKRSP